MSTTNRIDPIQMINVDRIDPHPLNPRHDLGDLGDLVKSIKAQGIRQNLLLVPNGTSDTVEEDGKIRHATRYTVVIGHRRLAAAKIAKLDQVPVSIDRNLDEAQQLELMLVENLQRTDLTPIEEAEGYRRLFDLGVTEAGISKAIGIGAKTIKSRLQLLTLPEVARFRIHNGQGSLVDAVALEGFADDPETQERLAGKLGTVDFARLVQEAKNARKLRADQAPLVEALLAAGATESTAAYPVGMRYARQVNLEELTKYTVPEGAVFARSTWSASVTIYTPSAQSVEEDVDAAAARDAEWAAKRAANEALYAQEKAARDVRDAWIREYLTGKMTPAHRDAIVAAAAQRVLWGYVSSYGLGLWLGLESAKCNNDKAVRTALADWTQGKPPAASLLLFMHLEAGTALSVTAIPLYEALKACGFVASEAELLRVYGEPIAEDEDDPDDEA